MLTHPSMKLIRPPSMESCSSSYTLCARATLAFDLLIYESCHATSLVW